MASRFESHAPSQSLQTVRSPSLHEMRSSSPLVLVRADGPQHADAVDNACVLNALTRSATVRIAGQLFQRMAGLFSLDHLRFAPASTEAYNGWLAQHRSAELHIYAKDTESACANKAYRSTRGPQDLRIGGFMGCCSPDRSDGAPSSAFQLLRI